MQLIDIEKIDNPERIKETPAQIQLRRFVNFLVFQRGKPNSGVDFAHVRDVANLVRSLGEKEASTKS